MRHDVIERLLANKQAAAAQVGAVLAACADGTLSAGQMRERLFAYVLAKFGLDEDDAPSRNLEALAATSLAQTLKTNPAQAAETDRSPTCDGARSVDMKQALLVMAMQREFGVALDGIRAGLADSTDDLADLVFVALNSTKEPAQ